MIPREGSLPSAVNIFEHLKYTRLLDWGWTDMKMSFKSQPHDKIALLCYVGALEERGKNELGRVVEWSVKLSKISLKES